MHHVNIEILKENQNLRKELKELTEITKTCLNNSNKVNQCIIEPIPTQKKRILGADQLNEDPSSFGQKGLVFVKYSANDTKVSIPGVERPWLSKAEGFILPNHDTGRILPSESQVITNLNCNIKKKKWLVMSLGKQSVGSSNSVRRPKSKDNKSKNSVLKNTKDSSTNVWKTINSICLDSNKCETKPSNVCQTNACITNSMTVNAINDGLNILCISCCLDVFLPSHDKCVARHALTRKSSVKRALFTSPVVAKSKGLGATSVVVKSRFSVAKTTTATNKLVLWIVDSRCSKHMTGNFQLLRNFFEKFMGIVCFGNNHFAAITGYGDYVQGNLTICHVYYVKGLGYNLFSVGQFCDGDLEVAFRSNTCYVRNLEGDDLITDLCGPMRVASINGKKYILVIVDDYSRYTWVYFLRTKDEAPDMIIDFVNQVQRNLKASILTIRTDNGTEFKNEKLRAFYAKLGIVHKTSIARTPQQNGVVERRNRTLVEAARTMLIFSKAPEFLWAEAIATACFTQNRSIVHTRHNKTPYELIRGRKPNADISIFVGYSESSRGFRIYNRHTKKIMEMIHVKFDELTAMASECNNLEPGMNCANFNNSSDDSQFVPSTSDLDNLFGLMYKEYYATRSQEVSDNSL
ncbi:retrovirus-related pol polyprotein from transposon TNT 1-94 [Tanacetum coccineum]|uniref:Retrovirus-related pol polyprotein from transposon TNT 1-94 n=1 Tax=Tanacetum coccineum TaxID=301880 RepID=A0ABQ4XWN7_9ASTR